MRIVDPFFFSYFPIRFEIKPRFLIPNPFIGCHVTTGFEVVP
ncbi:hypothetical protein ERS044134_02492, partial [Streptococcus pneumoniae]